MGHADRASRGEEGNGYGLRSPALRERRFLTLVSAVLALGIVCGGAAVALATSTGQVAAPHPTGAIVDRTVPDLPLFDEYGRGTSLAAFRGRTVVLAPFLTLCHEVCPLTTGAFIEMRRAVAAAGLGDRVAFVEVSVDPWRDSARRLRAFNRMTGARIALRTGTSAELRRFWRFFGVAFWRAPEKTPADRDWLTGKPLTFDVAHTDGLFVIDRSGHWRLVDLGMPSLRGRLSTTLVRLLNGEGKRNLQDPQTPWTVRQGLDDIGYVADRRIPDAPVAR